MADVFDKSARSEVMKKVRSKGNKSTEIRLMELFRENNIKGWRRGYQVKGHPDFVFLKERVAVFVDGCFWHGHDCRNTRPKDNEAYWAKKRDRNVRRDKDVVELFEARGWKVVRIWECELKKEKEKNVVERLRKAKDGSYPPEG